MIIIFGTKNRLVTSSTNDVIINGCPHCRANLELKDVKTYFTLFFMPIFPVRTVSTFYHCNSCDGSYRKEAREQLVSQA